MVSYRIVSYRIVSYRIVSYSIVSYRIVSYRIKHQVGGLFVVCGRSILVYGYLGISNIMEFSITSRGIISYVPSTCVGVPSRREVLADE